MLDIVNLVQPYLSGLGPWGVLIGFGLKIVVDRVRARNSDPQSPIVAALLALLKQPDPTPAPPPPRAVPEEHKRPLIDLLTKAISGGK